MPSRKLTLSLIASALLLFSANALADITFTQAAGASLVDLTGYTQGSTTGNGTTTTVTPYIYGGIAGTCTPASSTDTCDSCATQTSLVTCNHNNVSVNGSVVLTFTTTDTSATVAPEIRATSSSGVILDSAPNWTTGATSFTTTIPWATLCTNFSSGASSSCSSDGSLDIWVGFPSNSGATSYTTVHIVFRNANTTSNYSDCGTSDDGTNFGFCHFTTFPGDGKIYAEDLTAANNFPASPNASAKFTNLLFFYDSQQSSEDDLTILSRINSASSYFSLAMNLNATPPVADDRITGLSDGVRYCLVMASQDATGIINYFTPNTLFPGAGAQSDLCTSPEPVVGLLDDKHCFIATAAWGSDMAPEVQSFRDFRNKYLLPFAWGQKFVKTYYKYSPKYANMIAGNETAKTVVRSLLWPLLLFARMSVAFGFWISLAIMAAALWSFIELYRRLVLGRKVRGEL